MNENMEKSTNFLIQCKSILNSIKINVPRIVKQITFIFGFQFPFIGCFGNIMNILIGIMIAEWIGSRKRFD